MLAHHALAAGAEAAAFRHSLAAGQEALRLSAASEAIAHLEKARQMARETSLPALNPRRKFAICICSWAGHTNWVASTSRRELSRRSSRG